jgi:hypothetical protein
MKPGVFHQPKGKLLGYVVYEIQEQVEMMVQKMEYLDDRLSE